MIKDIMSLAVVQIAQVIQNTQCWVKKNLLNTLFISQNKSPVFQYCDYSNGTKCSSQCNWQRKTNKSYKNQKRRNKLYVYEYDVIVYAEKNQDYKLLN